MWLNRVSLQGIAHSVTKTESELKFVLQIQQCPPRPHALILCRSRQSDLLASKQVLETRFLEIAGMLQESDGHWYVDTYFAQPPFKSHGRNKFKQQQEAHHESETTHQQIE